jgi:ribonuclease P protein component
MAPDPLNTAPAKRLGLRKRQEFLAVAAGRRVNLPLLTLQYRPRDIDDPDANLSQSEAFLPRFGLTITKKIGNSVIRNRIRRRLRAALDQISPSVLSTHDYVIIARHGCLTAPFHSLVETLNQALHKSHRPLKPSPTVARAADPLSP